MQKNSEKQQSTRAEKQRQTQGVPVLWRWLWWQVYQRNSWSLFPPAPKADDLTQYSHIICSLTFCTCLGACSAVSEWPSLSTDYMAVSPWKHPVCSAQAWEPPPAERAGLKWRQHLRQFGVLCRLSRLSHSFPNQLASDLSFLKELRCREKIWREDVEGAGSRVCSGLWMSWVWSPFAQFEGGTTANNELLFSMKTRLNFHWNLQPFLI